MMFELESLSAVDAFEPPEDCGLVVRDHVSLQPIHVGEILLANLATLQEKNQLVACYQSSLFCFCPRRNKFRRGL